MKEIEFLEQQLNIKRLTPLQQQGIEIAMREYAEYYHKKEVSKLSQHDVISTVCSLYSNKMNCLEYKIEDGKSCINCKWRKQTDL